MVGQVSWPKSFIEMWDERIFGKYKEIVMGKQMSKCGGMPKGGQLGGPGGVARGLIAPGTPPPEKVSGGMPASSGQLKRGGDQGGRKGSGKD